MKIETKGMTRKQITTILDGIIRNDNACITEGDMCRLFELYGDTYETECEAIEPSYELSALNNYWSEIRMFLPRLGYKLKGIRL